MKSSIDDIYKESGFMTRSKLTKDEFQLTPEESDTLVKYQHQLKQMLDAGTREYFVKSVEGGARKRDFTYYRHELAIGPMHQKRLQGEIDRVNSFLDCFSGKLHSAVNSEIVENTGS